MLHRLLVSASVWTQGLQLWMEKGQATVAKQRRLQKMDCLWWYSPQGNVGTTLQCWSWSCHQNPWHLNVVICFAWGTTFLWKLWQNSAAFWSFNCLNGAGLIWSSSLTSNSSRMTWSFVARYFTSPRFTAAFRKHEKKCLPLGSKLFLTPTC